MRAFKTRLPRFILIIPALLMLVSSLGTTCIGNILPPTGGLNFTAVPTGCGVKVSNTETISWSIKFTASGASEGSTYEWFFGDGTGSSGQVVVHSFITRGLQSGTTGSHVPVNFDVTLLAGGQSITKRIGVPMRGTPDGGPEPGGDVCVPDEGRTHVGSTTELCYTNNPPASGPHYSAAGVAPVQPGVYHQDDLVRPEQWVHNLEHGTIVLLYDCGGPCSDSFLTQLDDLFDAVPASPRFNEKKMVITPYPGLRAGCTGTPTFPGTASFLAISWDVQRAFASLDTNGIIAFYLRHVDQAPEDAPIPEGEHNDGG